MSTTTGSWRPEKNTTRSSASATASGPAPSTTRPTGYRSRSSPINCVLAEIGREAGCQTMVEGPGHVPIDEIEANIIMEKRMSGESPFYMLGPITTDIAPGYDHITAAIGAALSSSYGADFICYVTPSEHLGLPFPEDVREGVIASRIAAHIGDMIKHKERLRTKRCPKRGVT